ncbi:hypothetical protein MgSA37_01465 [Mucilaginibacter gotjawali]|uniref:Uncharacterized protein n=2 Tax=Mucilaginibacter gotjawali TaxID=1550579 RepID=A0A839SBE0_9SPHI|nr:hypothetical protein [Mucilaginibacter gotjawali]BAU53298.1 hypothetical protein MgSA37_01465 [Mucilaginibacter gotjawali]
MLTHVIKYSLKIWLTSVFAAPILFYISLICWVSTYRSNAVALFPWAFLIYIGMVFAQLVFSLLIWIIFTGVILAVIRIPTTGITKTIIIFVTGLLLTAGPFVAVIILLDFNNEDSGLAYTLMACNCACVGFGVWFYKLKLLQPNPPPQNFEII